MSLTHDDRPWGCYDVLDTGACFQVKRICVNPGHRLSYQRHERRSEHWYVISGHGVVTLDGTERHVGAGDAVEIPVGAAHRAANPGEQDFVFIEVQRGSYFGEDDIVRLHDDYARCVEAELSDSAL